jgi:hypothetical protein
LFLTTFFLLPACLPARLPACLLRRRLVDRYDISDGESTSKAEQAKADAFNKAAAATMKGEGKSDEMTAAAVAMVGKDPTLAGERLAAKAARGAGGREEDEACCLLRFQRRPSRAFLVGNLKQLLNLLQVNAYMQGYDAALDGQGQGQGQGQLTITVTNPATRWSQQVLAQRNALVANGFEAKVVAAYLRACGVDYAAPPRTSFRGSDVVHSFRITGGLAD